MNRWTGGKPLQFSLQTKLFATFFLLLVFVLGCFLVYVQLLVIQPLKERTVQDTLLTASKVSGGLDNTIAIQNQLSQRLLSNRDVFSFLYEAALQKPGYTMDDLQKKRVLSNLMFQAIGPSLNIHDMVIYNVRGERLASYVGYSDMPTLEPVLGSEDLRSRLENSDYILYAPAGQPVSFIRSIVDVNGTAYGYLSIQLDRGEIQSLAEAGSIGSVYVVDRSGTLVTAPPGADRTPLDGSGVLPLRSEGIYKDAEGNYVAYHHSALTEWTVFVVQPAESVLGSVNSVRNVAIIFLVSLTLFSFLYIYLTSKSLVLPIRRIRSQIVRLNYSNLSLKQDSRLHNNDLLLLSEAFQELLDRLQDSIEREKLAVHKEAMARHSALQAQIAPHFIHNVLYLISIAAQEDKKEAVSEMCKSLSENLRYVVSSPYEHVTLSEEIGHTRHYLTLIGHQYEEDLTWTFDIEPAAESILLPRLVIQPFVENCIQHAFNRTDPPWHIEVKARLYNGLWAVEISDNGSGFEESSIREILKKTGGPSLGETEQEGLPAGIGRMGIVNTIGRLQLMYRNRLFFNLYNHAGGRGATIQIIASLTRDFY
ncbi:sensor histidine kinase [Paenibacillus sp. S-38]|uniref:sensor histidine kinase n=1 Tax=Paenibacillus sp. S-38 TaxID=3416710 RepID=UPI003CF969B7